MIEEASLYANLHVETSPVATTASWTDHIATVRDVSLSRGGYEPFIGVNQTEVGSGTISLVNNTATIEPGYWVRVRYSSTNVWAGYVQDVNTTYTFIDGVEYAVKTLVVLDWVAWIAQWSFDSYPQQYYWFDRVKDINLFIDPSGGNKPIKEYAVGSTGYYFAELIGNFAVGEVLDLLANSLLGTYWKSTTNSPTGSTSGMDDLVDLYFVVSSTLQTLTDGSHTGSPTNLCYYNDIEMVKQSSNVVNNVVISNLMNKDDTEMMTTEYQQSDSTSVATYGSRLATVSTSISSGRVVNLFPYPSFETLQSETDSTNFFYSVEQPEDDSTGGWSAYSGNRAFRAYNKTGAGTSVALSYDHRMNIDAGTTYRGLGYAATSGTPNTRARYRVQWYDDANAVIATSYGSYVSLTSYKTWYPVTFSTTAPANSVYARIGISYDRTTGAAFGATSKQWADAMYFGTTTITDGNWFDGDTQDTTTYLYDWYGTPNSSESFRMSNFLDTLATDFLTDNKTPKYSPVTIRMNAQASLTTATALDLYKWIYVWQGGHQWQSTITGLTHNININADGTTRWMVDIIVRPSTYTI